MRAYAITLTLVLASLAAGDVIKYVDPGATGADNGSSWADANDSLSEVVADPYDCDGNTENYIIYLRSTGGADPNRATIPNTWGCSSTYRLYIICQPQYRHDGTRGTGYRIVTNDGYNGALESYEPYVVINGLALCNTNETDDIRGIWLYDGASDNLIVNCLIYDCYNEGIYGASGVTDANIINTLIYNCGSDGIRPNGNYWRVANCTVMGCGGNGIVRDDFQTMYVHNCYAGGSTGSDYAEDGANGSYYIYYSMSEDGTVDDYGEGSNQTPNVTYDTSLLTNVTSGSENGNVVSGSTLCDAGYDYDGETWWPLECESGGDGLAYDGTTVRSSWDIGADEYEAGGSTALPWILHLYRRRQ